MNFLSVCSGIEAASVAWHPLGWKAVAFSEVDKFANAVLAHHYPTVPNLGDMTKFHEWQPPAFSLLVGGTPCQAFSVAGLRAGLSDPRGNLTLTFLALAGKHRPRWVVWENVPGVLSDRTNAFGHFLAGLGELGYGWAYRVLDAQHFGVPQRRRRVFVVGCLGDWRGAAEVLFERESLRGYSPPRREARQTSAAGAGSGAEGGSLPEVADCLQERDGRGPDTKTKTGHLIPDVSPTLRAGGNKTGGDRPPGTDVDTCESLLPIAFGSKDSGEDAMLDLSPTLRAGVNPNSHANGGVPPAIAIQERAICENPAAGPDGIGVRTDDTAYTLEARQVPQAVMSPRMAVRRLTPVECERLQGFPDNYTNIPWRKGPCPDGPRYKVLGNSMAVPVMNWIGKRIAMIDAQRFPA